MAFDANLMLRAISDGDLDASENGAYVDIGMGGLPEELTVRVVVKADATGTDTVTIKIQSADDTAGGGLLEEGTVSANLITGTDGGITKAGEYFMKIHPKKRYIRHVATLTSTASNMGTVEIGIVAAGRYNKH